MKSRILVLLVAYGPDFVKEDILRLVRKSFTKFEIDFEVFHTESDFRTWILCKPGCAAPDLALFQENLKWADPSPKMLLPPSEVEEEGFMQAGFRCEKLMRQHFSEVPIVVFGQSEECRISTLIDNMTGNSKYVLMTYEVNHVLPVLREAVFG